MQLLRRVISNVVISLLGQAITWFSTILLTAAYGRFLGDTRFGELYFAITFVALIGFPIEFGFNQQLTRDVAQQPEQALRYVTNTLILKCLLWVVFYAALCGLSWLLGYPSDERLLIETCGITLLFSAITNTFAGLHSAFGRTYFSAIGTIFERVLDAAAGIFLLRAGAGVEVMALVLLLGSLTNMSWQGIWCFCKVGFFQRPNRAFMLSLFKSSLPFLIYGVLGVIYYRIDTVMLSLMMNDTVVGWYGAAYRLFDTLLFLPSLVISAIIYPIFSKLSLHSEQQLKLAIEKTMNFVLFCAVPISTFLVIAAPQIIGFLYHNPDFYHSITTLQALAPGLIFLYANSVLGAILLSTHQERKLVVLAGSALIFNVVANFLLIPLLEQVGTALTTSATELVLLIVSLVLVPNRLLPARSLLITLRILLAAAAMGASLWWLRTYSLLVLFPVGLLVYLALALLCQALPLSDLRSISTSLRSRKQGSLLKLGELDHNQVALLSKVDTVPLPTLEIVEMPETDAWLELEAVVNLATRPLSDPQVVAANDMGDAFSTGEEEEEACDSQATLPRIRAQQPVSREKATREQKTPTLSLPVTPQPLHAEMEDDDPTMPRLPRVMLPQAERKVSS